MDKNYNNAQTILKSYGCKVKSCVIKYEDEHDVITSCVITFPGNNHSQLLMDIDMNISTLIDDVKYPYFTENDIKIISYFCDHCEEERQVQFYQILYSLETDEGIPRICPDHLDM
jgi:hypothetical protein